MKKLIDIQGLRYVMTGGMTTIVNYVLYFALSISGINYLIANSGAWLGAVIFAYFSNRKFVFKSQDKRVVQFISFFSVRLMTLFMENGLLFMLVDCVGANDVFSKVAISMLTVAGNYFLCKYGVFKERGMVNE